MKVAKATEKEIYELQALLNEMDWLASELSYCYLGDIDWDNYEILSKMNIDKDDEFFAENLLTKICKRMTEIHHAKILLNLITLLDNCADKNCDVLEFNPDIKKAIDFYNEHHKSTIT